MSLLYSINPKEIKKMTNETNNNNEVKMTNETNNNNEVKMTNKTNNYKVDKLLELSARDELKGEFTTLSALGLGTLHYVVGALQPQDLAALELEDSKVEEVLEDLLADGVELNNKFTCLIEALEELSIEGSEVEECMVEEILDKRLDAHLIMTGLKLAGIDITPDINFLFEGFDRDFEPHQWRVTAVTQAKRFSKFEWAMPKLREELWWYHRGRHIPSACCGALYLAADLLSAYPQTREELHNLIWATEIMDSPRKP